VDIFTVAQMFLSLFVFLVVANTKSRQMMKKKAKNRIQNANTKSNKSNKDKLNESSEVGSGSGSIALSNKQATSRASHGEEGDGLSDLMSNKQFDMNQVTTMPSVKKNIVQVMPVFDDHNEDDHDDHDNAKKEEMVLSAEPVVVHDNDMVSLSAKVMTWITSSAKHNTITPDPQQQQQQQQQQETIDIETGLHK